MEAGSGWPENAGSQCRIRQSASAIPAAGKIRSTLSNESPAALNPIRSTASNESNLGNNPQAATAELPVEICQTPSGISETPSQNYSCRASRPRPRLPAALVALRPADQPLTFARSLRLLPRRSSARRLVRAPAPAANGQPVLRTHRPLAQQGRHARQGGQTPARRRRQRR